MLSNEIDLSKRISIIIPFNVSLSERKISSQCWSDYFSRGERKRRDFWKSDVSQPIRLEEATLK
jgi:hypothetical protein